MKSLCPTCKHVVFDDTCYLPGECTRCSVVKADLLDLTECDDCGKPLCVDCVFHTCDYQLCEEHFDKNYVYCNWCFKACYGKATEKRDELCLCTHCADSYDENDRIINKIK